MSGTPSTGSCTCSGGTPAGAAPPPVQVFEHDIYTVVLATNASLIPDALRLVPEHRRIPVNRPLFDFYAQNYPEHAIALCCFDNRDATRSDPLLLWYVPRHPDRREMPAVDCHTGDVPRIGTSAPADHCVILGTDEPVSVELDSWSWRSAPMFWSDSDRSGPVGPFLPDAIVGRTYTGSLPNGDFMIPHADLLAGRLSAMSRVGPDGEPLPSPLPSTPLPPPPMPPPPVPPPPVSRPPVPPPPLPPPYTPYRPRRRRWWPLGR